MLRFLISVALVAGSAGTSTRGFAQSYELGPEVRQSIDRALDEANTTGRSLMERINILKQTFDLPETARPKARDGLGNARVRTMLGVGEGSTFDVATGGADMRYPHGVYVFASFSMPGGALRQLLTDAADLGVPVVFNGFVNNSAFETEAVMRRLFANDSSARGFIIDPTLFVRFDIAAVPAFVTTNAALDVCDTPGCVQDFTPEHDVLRGNVPLRSALEIIAQGNGTAPEPARRILEDQE